jgi:hypothetical protein
MRYDLSDFEWSVTEPVPRKRRPSRRLFPGRIVIVRAGRSLRCRPLVWRLSYFGQKTIAVAELMEVGLVRLGALCVLPIDVMRKERR